MIRRSLILGALLLLFFTGCSQEPASAEKSSSPHTIKYEVVGTGACTDAFLTYNNKDDDTSQISAATLPWTYTFTTSDIYFFLYISAQNNHSSGSVTTRIYIDDTLKKETTSTGSYVIATSSGTISGL